VGSKRTVFGFIMNFSKITYCIFRLVQSKGILLTALLCVSRVYGQEVEMSQYWAAPLHVNPALAGISYGPRFMAGYRNQWPSLGDGFNGGFVTYTAGADLYLEKIRSGIGLLYTGDYIAGGLLSTNKITLSYAVQVKLSKKVGMRLGLEGSFIQRHINWSQLQFYDMIDPYTGFYSQVDVLNPSLETPPDRLNTYRGDVGAGILLFSDKVYGGFSIRNLLTPNPSFFDNSTAGTPPRMTAHLGTHFNIRHARNYRYNIFVSPNVLIANQGKNVQLNAGMMAGVSMVYFGAWFRYAYRNADALIFVAGFKKGKFRFGYSYDATLSRLAKSTGGSHEVTMVFNLSGNDDNSLHPNRKKAYIECPEILNF
jgi:type IX secretion system PorP/SprF family membrane protein